MMPNRAKAFYLIESGLALDLVKSHIAARIAARTAGKVICDELGVTEVLRCRIHHTISAVMFNGPVHTDFKKPDKRGASFPRKGTPWAKRFADQVGAPSAEEDIAKAFSVPLSVEYTLPDGTYGGWSSLGGPINACGFAYLSENGPFALVIPDVAHYVAAQEAQGYTVLPPAKGFGMDLPGCRRIEEEEWQILELQEKLSEKRAAAAAKAMASVLA